MTMRTGASVLLAIIILACVGWFAFQPKSSPGREIPPPPPPEIRAAMRAEIQRRLASGELKVPTASSTGITMPTSIKIKPPQVVHQ